MDAAGAGRAAIDRGSVRIWLDLANSPQVLFFRPLLAELHRRGHVVEVTTRAYAQTIELADKFGIPHTQIGQHGGRSLIGLVRRNFGRAVALAAWARPWRFDLALSHNSYSQVVAAMLLQLPAVTLMDYEHQPLNHLCFRLARRVIVPEVFPTDLLRKYGAISKTLTFPGVKEQVYLSGFEPQSRFREMVGLPIDRPLFVIRPPAPWTAYHRFENDLFTDLLGRLAAENNKYVLFLPRLPAQADSVKDLAGIHIAPQVYDGPNLLYHADVVVSGGGTMNREAAVLGSPAFSIFEGKSSAVDRHLISLGRLDQLRTANDFERLVHIAAPKRKPVLANRDLVDHIVDQIVATVN